MKKPITEHIGDFLTGRGFYIVLFLCIAAIGISGYYLMNVLSSPAEEEPSAVMDPVEEVVVPTVSPSPEETVPEETASAAPSPSPSPSPQPSQAAEETVTTFTWPVKGDILAGFSLETLCYDETMGDFRTHSGVDIAASAGSQVVAMARGTVEKVYEDAWMGTTVIISHPGGLESVYCNLSASPTVSEGDEVTRGQVLGTVGGTALAEVGMDSHLHLEMWEDTTAVDPMDYLPQ